MRPDSRLVSLIFSVCCLVAGPATAKQEVSLILDCPRLENDPELAAHFEARALVELRLSGGRSGKLAVHCDAAARRTLVSWEGPGREPLREVVGAVQDDEDWVEQLVAKVWQLGETRAEREKQQAAPEPEPAPVVEPPEVPVPRPPASRLHLVLGAPLEFHPQTVLLGVRGGFGLSLPPGWRSTLTAGPSYVTASLDPIDVLLWNAHLDLARTIVNSPFSLGLGIGGVFLDARGGGSLEQARRSAWGLSAAPFARAAFETRHLFFALSAGPVFYAVRPQITIDERSVLELSPVAGFFQVQIGIPVARF